MTTKNEKGRPWSTVIVANTHTTRTRTTRVNRRRQIKKGKKGGGFIFRKSKSIPFFRFDLFYTPEAIEADNAQVEREEK